MTITTLEQWRIVIASGLILQVEHLHHYLMMNSPCKQHRAAMKQETFIGRDPYATCNNCIFLLQVQRAYAKRDTFCLLFILSAAKYSVITIRKHSFQILPWELGQMQQSHRGEDSVWRGNGGVAEAKPWKIGKGTASPSEWKKWLMQPLILF